MVQGRGGEDGEDGEDGEGPPCRALVSSGGTCACRRALGARLG